jgi:16S rRNA processing protein RimM
MAADDTLVVGRVARAHGNRGHVIVNPETDFLEERFRVGQTLLVGAGAATPRRVVAVRFHQGRPIVGFEGVTTMTEAEQLAGAELRMPAEALGDLPAGTFYHHDLAGCEVTDRAGVALGVVTAVEGPMERSRLVVQGRRGEIQIPLTDAFCVTVDPAARRIVVDLPDGLVELNETGRREQAP